MKGQTGVDQGKVPTQRVESLDLELGGFYTIFSHLAFSFVFLFYLLFQGFLSLPQPMYTSEAHDGQQSGHFDDTPESDSVEVP